MGSKTPVPPPNRELLRLVNVRVPANKESQAAKVIKEALTQAGISSKITYTERMASPPPPRKR